ncbi:MAG TPA: DUF805 domain-containing protein [Rhizomicrobium sp.]|nr:DUF805 domain-containing protein [Rhizomicrobium sp.]
MDWREFFFGREGRIDRSDFWQYFGLLVLYLVFAIVVLVLAGGSGMLRLVLLGLPVYPTYVIALKRMHDRDKDDLRPYLYAGGPFAVEIAAGFVPLPASAAWIPHLIMLALLVAALVELGITRGTRGANRFGEDPVVEHPVAPGGYQIKIAAGSRGGETRHQFFYVASHDAEHARRLVRDAHGAPDEAVKVMSPILHQTVERHGLGHGEFIPAPRQHFENEAP